MSGPAVPIRILELRSVRGTGGGPEKTIILGAMMSDPRYHVTVCYLRDQRDSVFAELAQQTESAIVQRIGNGAVFYRPRRDKPRIILPAD